MMQGHASTFKDAPDLFCHETLSYFDDENYANDNISSILSTDVSVENALKITPPITSSTFDTDKKIINKNHSTTDSKETNRYKTHSLCHKRINCENFDNCISMLDDDDYVKLLHSDKILDIDNPLKRDNATGHHLDLQNNFTSNLIKEFTNFSTTDPLASRSTASTTTTTSSWINSDEKTNLRSHNNWSQTPSRLDGFEQQVPEITMDMDDENEVEDGSRMDVLIIKDEATCDSDSGSEFDWNSLTPPVPASPSDQRVPETESELDLCTDEYDYRIASSSSAESFLSSSFAPVEHSGYHWYFQQQTSFQNVADISQSDADQVVPVL